MLGSLFKGNTDGLEANLITDALDDVVEVEKTRVNARRDEHGLAKIQSPQDAVCLSFSGGGIRSATFALGVMRAFANARLLECMDYLSTVSGGGYVGSFFVSLFARRPGGPSKNPYEFLRGPVSRPPNDPLHNNWLAWPLWWLRSSGRYLAPTGAGDYVYALALAIRNLVAVHYVLGLVLLTFGVMAIALDAYGRSHLSHWLIHVSPGWYLYPGATALGMAAVLLLVGLLPLGLAYYITEMPKLPLREGQPWWHSTTWMFLNVLIVLASALTAVAAMALHQRYPDLKSNVFVWVGAVLVAIMVMSQLQLGMAARRVKKQALRGRPDGVPALTGQVLSTRVLLTKRLATMLKWALACLGVAALLAASYWLKKSGSGIEKFFAAVLVPASIALVKNVAPWLKSAKDAGGHSSAWMEMAVNAAGFVLAAIVCVVWFMVVWYALALPADAWDALRPVLMWALVVLLVLGLLTGRAFQFVNLSTIQNLYASRLVRAYLGASNPARAEDPPNRWIQISDTHPEDNLNPDVYYHPTETATATKAPLHIINVTVNETVSPKDPLVQRDRHGRPMALSPGHVCVDGVFHPWSPKKPGPWEAMSIGAWVGISGAAFSTGIGRNTSIGKSLLLGLANVRLGYWWQAKALAQPSDRSPVVRQSIPQQVQRAVTSLFATQHYLLSEFSSRFRGVYAPYWYLSDGGHFENTAVFEALRRRIGTIICTDAGADPNYGWEDLANLMRLARIEFGCEFLEVLPGGDSGNPVLKSLDQLLISPDAHTAGHADDLRCVRCFWVTYPLRESAAGAASAGSEGTLLLVLKPRLIHTAPVDVQQYARSHPPFPQESTADQFFSEEQWESYRKLGECIGEAFAHVLCPATAVTPSPAQLLAALQALRSAVATRCESACHGQLPS